MVVKLNSLSRWSILGADEAISFKGSADGERTVRIDFNLEGVTTLFIGTDKGAERFLCTIGPGVETVQFNVAGEFKIYAEKGSGAVHYLSADLEPTFSEVVDPVIFTRIATRRHRNPELEEMMYRAQANIERRFAQQAQEMEAAFERRLKEATHARPAEKVVSNAPGAASAAPEQKVSGEVAAGEKPGEAPADKAGGEQSGGGSGGSA